jgi:hypothetical protein
MKKHVKIYFDFFDLTGEEFIPCEICHSRAVDIHHINCRGMSSTKDKDKISNLMAVCRDCHIKFGDKKQFIDFLQNIHNEKIKK